MIQIPAIHVHHTVFYLIHENLQEPFWKQKPRLEQDSIFIN